MKGGTTTSARILIVDREPANEPGHGATFVIDLPVGTPSAPVVDGYEEARARRRRLSRR